MVFLITITLGFTSCDQNRVFEDYHGMSTQQWGIEDTISFVVPPVAENAKAYMAIRYNDSYDFHNLYVKYIVKDSLSTVLEEEMINLHLFDSKTGKPKGDGFGNTYTLFHPIPMKNLGNNYQFIQYMRQPELDGIEAIGLKIEKD